MSIFVDLDLLLELRGLQFCVARTAKFLESSHLPTLLGAPMLQNASLAPLLLPLLSSVKPRLHAFSFMSALERAHRPSRVFSFVEEAVTRQVLRNFPWIPQPPTLVTYSDCIEKLRSLASKDALVLVPLPDVAQSLRRAGVSSMCVPVSKHQGLPLQSLHAAVPGLLTSALDEFSAWQSYSMLPAPVQLSGLVMHGFGKGSTELGFPTANIEPQQTCIAAQLVPGIYCGFARVEGDQTQYKAAVSIGWNPQYDNTVKTTEVYLLHTFSQPFYGKSLTVQLVAYLRAEAAFESVADLVKAIQYDVQLTEKILSS